MENVGLGLPRWPRIPRLHSARRMRSPKTLKPVCTPKRWRTILGTPKTGGPWRLLGCLLSLSAGLRVFVPNAWRPFFDSGVWRSLKAFVPGGGGGLKDYIHVLQLGGQASWGETHSDLPWYSMFTHCQHSDEETTVTGTLLRFDGCKWGGIRAARTPRATVAAENGPSRERTVCPQKLYRHLSFQWHKTAGTDFTIFFFETALGPFRPFAVSNKSIRKSARCGRTNPNDDTTPFRGTFARQPRVRACRGAYSPGDNDACRKPRTGHGRCAASAMATPFACALPWEPGGQVYGIPQCMGTARAPCTALP